METKRTIKQLQADAELILRETNNIAAQRRQGTIKALSDRIKSSAEALEHSQRSAAYVEFKQSEAYIQGLQEAIAATGIVAIDTAGNSLPLQWLDDSRTSCRFFGTLKVGSTVQVNGYQYLVESFTFSFAGSVATVIALSAKMHISGTQPNPYNAIAVNWNHGSKTLTVPTRDRLLPGQHVVINGNTYEPVSSFLVKGFHRYEMAEVAV